MGQYTAAVPDGALVKPEIQQFYEKFYQISDTPSGHEEYADMFTTHAKLIMASNEANGRDEIIKMRHGMWEKVATRSHKPAQLYPFGADSDSIMLFGSVDYELKDGKKTVVQWAARSHFTSAEGYCGDGSCQMKDGTGDQISQPREAIQYIESSLAEYYNVASSNVITDE